MTATKQQQANDLGELSAGKTVVALASPAATAAIALIQLAGRDAASILSRHLQTALAPRTAAVKLDYIQDADARPIDQILVSCLGQRPAIYEITCHGGLRVAQRIVDTFRRAGAELCTAETLTAAVYRLNNPLARDAYRLLPKARTALAVKFLLCQGQLDPSDMNDPAEALRYWPAVRHLIFALTVVLAGPANAGKSTLLNFLADHEQALVADIPGTTRDYVQAEIEIAGLPVCLIDTAGMGRTADPLAEKARAKTRQACELADLAIIVLDAVNPQTLPDQLAQALEVPALEQLFDQGKAIVSLNKIDRPHRIHSLNELPAATVTLEISALAGTNIEKLESSIRTLAGLDGFDYRKPTVFTEAQAARARQRQR